MTEYIMQNMPRILSRRLPLRTHTYVSASPLSGFCFLYCTLVIFQISNCRCPLCEPLGNHLTWGAFS